MARWLRTLLDFAVSVFAFVLFLVCVFFILGSHYLAMALHGYSPNPLYNVLLGAVALEACVGSYLLARKLSGEPILRYGCRLVFLYGALLLGVKLPGSFFFSWYTGERLLNDWGGMGRDEAIFIVAFGVLAVLNWVWFEKRLRRPTPAPPPDSQLRRWFY